MTYKIKYSFFHPVFANTNNSQGYSGISGTEIPKEIYKKIVATDKDLASRFEQEGVIPNILKSAKDLKAEIEELTQLLAQKTKEEKSQKTDTPQ